MKCPETGKHMHEDEAAAKRHIISLRHSGSGWDVVAYYCTVCKCYHVGHDKTLFVKRIRRVTHKKPTGKRSKKR